MGQKQKTTTKITYKYTSAKYWRVFFLLTLVSLITVVSSFIYYFYESSKTDLFLYLPNQIDIPSAVAISISDNKANLSRDLVPLDSLAPVAKTNIVPQMPSVYLLPQHYSIAGLPYSTGAAVWKVFYSSSLQSQFAVSIQSQITPDAAISEVQKLSVANSNPQPTDSSYTISLKGTFNQKNISNSYGYIWNESKEVNKAVLKSETYLLTYHVDTKVVILSMTSYNQKQFNVTEFNEFVNSENSILNSNPFKIYAVSGISAAILTPIFLIIAFILKGRSGTRYLFADDPIKSYETSQFASTNSSSNTVPAGWYTDPYAPSSDNILRYFDGIRWTEHVHKTDQQ